MTTHWNFRLCKNVVDGKERFSFREVYYDKDEVKNFSTEEYNVLPLSLDYEEGEGEEDIKSVYRFTLTKLLECLDKPILDLDFIEKSWE